jgi:hypothetical protein
VESAVGTANSVIACVVELSIPMLLVPLSANQMLPSDPVVIPYGVDVAPPVGMVNSETTWVVALIAPILPTPRGDSENQRLLVGPDVISKGRELAVLVGKSTIDARRQRNSRLSRFGRVRLRRPTDFCPPPLTHLRNRLTPESCCSVIDVVLGTESSKFEK